MGKLADAMAMLDQVSVETASGPRALLRRLPGASGTILAFGVRILAAAMAYVLNILLARALGAAEFGTFSFAWSLTTLGGFLATLGFGQITVRFLAQYHETQDFARARGFLRVSFAATLLGAALIAGLILIALPMVAQGYGPELGAAMLIGLVALPFFALTDLIEGMARSQGWTFRALAPPYLVRQGAIILTIMAALWLGMATDARFAMQAALGATILAMFTQAALTLPALLHRLPSVTPIHDMRLWRDAARPTLLADFAQLARQNIDLILLGLLAPPAALGIYFAATRIASLIGLIEFAVNATFGHRFARAVEAGDNAAIRPIYAAARRLTALPGLGVGVTLMAAAPFILALFGADFAAAYPATLILLGASMLRLALGPAEDALIMGGHPASAWRANLIGMLVTMILCLYLCPVWQATGAAIAAGAGNLAAALMLAFALRRKLGISPFKINSGIARP